MIKAVTSWFRNNSWTYVLNAMVILVMILLMPVVCLSAGKVVRDGNGRLIERWSDSGNGRVDVRGPNGRLKYTRTKSGDRVVIRDGNGRLVGEERTQ